MADFTSSYRRYRSFISATTYTLSDTDNQKTLIFTSPTDVTLTFPILTDGFTCKIIQRGAGLVKFSPASGVTLENVDQHTRTKGQGAKVYIEYTNVVASTSAIVSFDGDTAFDLQSPYLIVATTGNDTTGDGSLAKPYATLAKAITVATAGTSIYLRGGTYVITSQVTISNKSGTSGSRYQILNYPGEKPVLDGTGITSSGYYTSWIIQLQNSSYWTIKGLELYRGRDGGFIINGSSGNLVIEQCQIHECGYNGTLTEGKGVTVAGTGDNILFKNVDSYENADSANGNADGFQCSTSGVVTFDTCRAWNNSDDGFDFFAATDNQNTGHYILKNCQAFHNGKLKTGVNSNGDGNGFKLGGRRTPAGNGVNSTSRSGGHTLTNCMAWSNKFHGFDENVPGLASDNTTTATTDFYLDANTLLNCISFNNQIGFQLNYQTHTVKNCVSYADGSLGFIKSSANIVTNSWTNPPNITVAAASFLSTDDSQTKGSRNADGTLPTIPFLRPAANSNLIDKGTNVGLPYGGTAPDLGAYEYAP